MLQVQTNQLVNDNCYYHYAKALSNSACFDLVEFINQFQDKKAVINYILECNLSDKVNRYIKQQFNEELN
jgi:hypothetical protein